VGYADQWREATIVNTLKRVNGTTRGSAHLYDVAVWIKRRVTVQLYDHPLYKRRELSGRSFVFSSLIWKLGHKRYIVACSRTLSTNLEQTALDFQRPRRYALPGFEIRGVIEIRRRLPGLARDRVAHK
jgi:hypothetical protein